ncbi:MAG: VOC family protein [Burkholderiaceae bacterium]
MATVRYLVNDVERSVAFYTEALGFRLEQKMAPAFARVSLDGLTLWLAGPPSSAARPMPDGSRPVPGGWNRFVVVPNLPQGACRRISLLEHYVVVKLVA